MRWGVLAMLLVGCSSTLDTRYPHRIDFALGEKQEMGDAAIEITELRGSRPDIAVGGEYLVRGRYRLHGADEGVLTFFLTADNWNNTGPIMDLQRQTVTRGEGTFELQHRMEGPGAFHVTIYDAQWNELFDQYIGARATVTPSSRTASVRR
ncbi:MAG: hypothetical protein AAGD14_19295 [Planctomycetota bacterium]